jgi:AcrR family transcriptional regulator
MNGFEKRKAQKKDNIRRAALELFRTYGFQKVSIGEIARRAGVSQVTIYNHFDSKEGLVHDVLKWHMTELLEKYLEIMSGERPFLEKLEYIVFDKAQIAAQFQGELMQTMIQDDPEIQEFVEELYKTKVNPAMTKFFNEGIQEGFISPKISMETILLYFEVIRHGFYDSPNITEQVNRKPEMLKELIQLMTYGLNG